MKCISFIADSRAMVLTLSYMRRIHKCWPKRYKNRTHRGLNTESHVDALKTQTSKDNKNCLTRDLKRMYVSSCQNSRVIGLCPAGGVGGHPIPAALCFAFQEQ